MSIVNRRSRILFVNDHLGFEGGVSHGGTTYLVSVLPKLKEIGVDCDSCVLRPWHPASAKLRDAGVEPTFLSRGKWDPRAIVDLVRMIKRREIDAVHLSGMKSHLLGRIAARRCRIPAIVHQHNVIPQNFLLRKLQQAIGDSHVKYLAVSGAARTLCGRTFGVADSDIETLHNGIDVTPFISFPESTRDDVRRSLDVGNGVVVGLFGRIFAGKGQDLAMRALRLVRDQCDDVSLLIVGDGPDRKRVTELICELGLQEAVVFTGHRDDVPELLQAVDFVIVPSMVEEAFGYTALEASCSGKAVVAFDSGGLPEVVAHGETGLIVEKSDVRALADAIVRLASDAALRDKLGRSGRLRAAQFSIDRHVQRLAEIYDELIPS